MMVLTLQSTFKLLLSSSSCWSTKTTISGTTGMKRRLFASPRIGSSNRNFSGVVQQRQQEKRIARITNNTFINEYNDTNGWGCFFSSTSSSNNNNPSSTSSSSSPPMLEEIHGTIPLNGKGVDISQYAQVERSFTTKDVSDYANLIKDMNPIHQVELSKSIRKDQEETQELENKSNITSNNTTTTNNGSVIVHGMLVASLFSSIFGTLVPGCIYVNQSLQFKQPVYVNDKVIGLVIIKKIRNLNKKKRKENILQNKENGDNHASATTTTLLRPLRGGVIVTCETKVIRCNNNNDNDSTSSEKEFICVIGEADVWLPTGFII